MKNGDYTPAFGPYLELFEPREAYVPEMRLQYAWKRMLWKVPRISEEGETIRILCPGRHNNSDGPDFIGARILRDGKLYAGDIEVHHHAVDWYAHGHHKDERYDHCVLHVVFHPAQGRTKSRSKQGHAIPVCYIPLEEAMAVMPQESSCLPFRADPENYFALLKETGWMRVSEKTRYFYENRLRFPWDVMLYWGVFKACGYRYNEENMVTLFMRFPWEDYCYGRFVREKISPVLHDLAGFRGREKGKEKIQWTYSRTRPMHFPEVRIAWLGALLTRNYGKSVSADLYRILWECGTIKDVNESFFNAKGLSIPTHYDPHAGRWESDDIMIPGRTIRMEMLLNTILPLLEAIRLDRDDDMPVRKMIRDHISTAQLQNSYGTIQRFHREHGINTGDKRSRNWLTAQGVLYIRSHYCLQDKQNTCPLCAMAKTDPPKDR